MTDYLLDTNHLSPLVTANHPLHGRVMAELRHGHTFSLTVANLAETLYGLGSAPRAERNLQIWEQLRPAFEIYLIDEEDAIDSAKLRIHLRRQGRQLGLVDSLLAIVALRYRLTLLTTDADFSAVPELPQANWLVM